MIDHTFFYRRVKKLTYLLIALTGGFVFHVEAQDWSVPEADSLALVQLYHATGGSNWTNNSGWLDPEVLVTNWYGINIIIAGDPPVVRVGRIFLNHNNLTGTIPDIFHNLDALEVIHLNNNNLTGTLPRSVRFLKSLETVRFHSNELTGVIPGEFGQLSLLRNLWLYENEFNSIESGIGQAKNLTTLYLHYNNLLWLPEEIGDLPSQLQLRVDNNRLLFIPHSLGRLRNVNLNNNQLSSLPELEFDTPMSILNVRENKLKFGDIEKNLNAVANQFLYNNQDSVQIYADREGNTVILSIEPVGGSDKTYDWYRDGFRISTGADSIFIIEDITSNGSGIYHCQIWNAATPNLFLSSRRILVIDELAETFFVRVMQDSLNHNAQPVANTDFQIGYLDLSNTESPIQMLETQFSDENGLLRLRPPFFLPEGPFIIRKRLHREPAVKGNRHEFENVMYTLYADNLIIDDNGNVRAQTLPESVSDTIDVYLTRTSFGYNLLVSIEWPVHREYAGGLRLAFLYANNLLFDISNGQAFFEKIAVYDDKRFWNDADIRIYASNGQWPSADINGIQKRDAFIHMPPKHFGEKWTNVNRSYSDLLLLTNTRKHIEMLIHEFGHYGFGFYDEYQDSSKRPVHIFHNFGFMDGVPGTGEMQSEMSAFMVPGYEDTEQYQRLGLTSWDYWEQETKQLLETFTGIRPQLYTPRKLGFGKNQIMAGPNQDLNRPDFSVGHMMQYIDRTSEQRSERFRYLVLDRETGDPVPRTQVAILKQRRRNGFRQLIDQGFTDRLGRIALLGADVGDDIRIMNSTSGQWRYHETLIGLPNNDGLQKTTEEDFALFLDTVTGVEPLLPGVLFNGAGLPAYRLSTMQTFATLPVVYVYADDIEPEGFSLHQSNGGYETIFEEAIPSAATISLRIRDETGMEFSVPQPFAHYQIDSPDRDFFSLDNQMRVEIESGIEEGSRLAILSSDFPAPQTGIEETYRRVSPVFALDMYPPPVDISGHVTIYIYADSLLPDQEDALVIYRWTEDQWTALPTVFHSEMSKASTPTALPGMYAAYIDPSKSIVTGTHDDFVPEIPGQFTLLQNYPNPFNPQTTIEFSLPVQQKITLRVYDVLGREVHVLVDEILDAGNHSVTFDASSVASGVYFYQLRSDTFILTKKMILLR